MPKLRTLTRGATFSFLLAAALTGCASGRQSANTERENGRILTSLSLLLNSTEGAHILL
jgi:hypothetical protein